MQGLFSNDRPQPPHRLFFLIYRSLLILGGFLSCDHQTVSQDVRTKHLSSAGRKEGQCLSLGTGLLLYQTGEYRHEHTRTHSHTQTHTHHTYTPAHTHTHTHTQACESTQTHTHTYTCTHTHTCTRLHTHTHTHTRVRRYKCTHNMNTTENN